MVNGLHLYSAFSNQRPLKAQYTIRLQHILTFTRSQPARRDESGFRCLAQKPVLPPAPNGAPGGIEGTREQVALLQRSYLRWEPRSSSPRPPRTPPTASPCCASRSAGHRRGPHRSRHAHMRTHTHAHSLTHACTRKHTGAAGMHTKIEHHT